MTDFHILYWSDRFHILETTYYIYTLWRLNWREIDTLGTKLMVYSIISLVITLFICILVFSNTVFRRFWKWQFRNKKAHLFYLWYLNLIHLILVCSMVWEKANEKNLFPTSGRTVSSLPWFWVDPGNPIYFIFKKYEVVFV